jgi:ABC-type glycerol-3-phosphate transport system permease component
MEKVVWASKRCKWFKALAPIHWSLHRELLVIGLQRLIPQADEIPYWNIDMAGSLLATMPPILVVLFVPRWFVKGLMEREK